MLLWLSLSCLYLFSAYFNYGFVAFDDYQSMIRVVFPAQLRDFSFLVDHAELRSPLARLFPWLMAKLFYFIGLENPLHQIQAVSLFLGILYLYFVYLFSKQSQYKHAFLVLALGAGLMPWLSTRFLFETQAAIFFFGGIVLAQSRKWAWSTLFLMLACIVRPQMGLCALVVWGFARNWRFTIYLALAFIALGVLEAQVRSGRFHESLLQYFVYNYHFSAGYGVYPFYFYIPLVALFVLLFSPVLKFKKVLPDNVYLFTFLIFFISHSMVGHKEERFFFAITPVFLVCLLPYLKDSLSLWSWKLTLALHVLIAIFLFSHVSQKNVIALSLENRFSKFYNFEDAAFMYPRSYALNPIPMQDIQEINLWLTALDYKNSALLVREDRDLTEFSKIFQSEGIVECARYSASAAEQFLIKLNAKANRRRQTLIAYCKNN